MSYEIKCGNDTDGDGDCHLCVRRPEGCIEKQSIQERLERADELEAELERVKAERDDKEAFAKEMQRQLDDQIKIRYGIQDELSSLKSRLPVNADGDVVLWGDPIWFWCKMIDGPSFLHVSRIKRVSCGSGEDQHYDFTGYGYAQIYGKNMEMLISACHSTSESCRAAAEGGEG